jgi:hypothetical protein
MRSAGAVPLKQATRPSQKWPMTALRKSTYYPAAAAFFSPLLHEDHRFARAFAFVDQISLCAL